MIKRGTKNKKAQLTIIILVAIVIVFAIVLYFYLRASVFQPTIPRNMRPVYDSYLDCLNHITTQGVYLLGQQGGYIEVPNFEPGSLYRPFSNQLDFLGQPVPYWMYISGNNILREQIPTKNQMKQQLENYIKQRLDFCSFSEYEIQGYGIFIEQGNVEIDIKDYSVELIAKNPITIYYQNDSFRINEHKTKINIPLGNIYNKAKELYNYHKTDMFLEKYTIDVLRLHAPVDGVELQCSPIVFNEHEIRKDVKKGLTANINFLKVKGNYYELKNKEHEYFVVEPGFRTAYPVNFLYSPDWPTRIEMYGEMVAEPVGIQEGLSILGFCYVPYHLVYDVNYPVLIQFFDSDFIFQFPVSVIIEKNHAREALPPMFDSLSLESQICQHKNQKVRVYTYDSELNPLPARIRFHCLDSECEIGATEMSSQGAYLEGDFPQCINGFIIASSPGYAQTRYQISTNTQTIADIILPKIYTIELDLGLDRNSNAVISFNGEKHSRTVLYPETQPIELIEDYYNVTVLVHSDVSLNLAGINERICVDVPVQGIGTLFGLTEEKCSDINIPDMKVDSALMGGGKTTEYITEDILKKSRKLNIRVPLFYAPMTIEDIQANYILAEESVVYIDYE